MSERYRAKRMKCTHREKKELRYDFGVPSLQSRFIATLAELKQSGSAYDPRRDRANMPRRGPVAVRAWAAHHAWQELQCAQVDRERWRQIVIKFAERKRAAIDLELRKLEHARAKQARFMAGAQRAGRRTHWRTLQRTVIYGMRWIRTTRVH
ncbi:hypothetical protein EIP91_001670 [Steccherinum ochraceum]|uniref:Uncharacterized protein n=1 Tax=Steccherinum ochraceum TaxID=92696 RepID=A0A4V6N761_9APHY|nr:hypothetical protein EIP91_001670 [Steccherinum ochraceum]